MSAAPFSPATESGSSGEPPETSGPGYPRHRRRRRRALVIGGVVVVLIAAGGAAAATGAFNRGGQQGNGVADNSAPTGVATVAKGSLSSQVQVNAALGYAGNYSVLNEASGMYTSLPSAGQIIGRGQVLYRVSNAPVVLLYGSVPVYRALSEGMRGPDVQQLNANLVALGYVSKAHLDPTSDYFNWWTAYALELYQHHLGLKETGKLALDQAVFLPSAVRVVSVAAQIGSAAGPGAAVLQGTSTARQVSISLDASEQSYVKRGDSVTITLPNNQTTPGVVSSVGTVATTPSGGTSPVISVTVTPTDPSATGSLDQAPVEVSITTDSVSDVLVVPVNALLSLANGGYAVEVVDPGGVHRLVPVSLGLFDDAAGTVQVSGSGLAAGQKVVVPQL